MRGPSDKTESNAARPGAELLAGRVRRKGDALPLPQQHERITVTSHRELLAMARVLAPRLARDPEFSVMLLANPVLALRHYGIELSKAMQRHVLETLRHPPKRRARRQALEQSLEAALGERPRPNDERWMARLVFELRGLEPRETQGAEPRYRAPLGAETVARLTRLRPAATRRYARARTSAPAGEPASAPREAARMRATIRLAARPRAVRLLDLDAAPPRDLPRAQRAPAGLTLEEAWFYTDDPLVRDAVELGQIERRAFPFRTPAAFRDLKAGKKLDAFGAWVRAVRIPGAEP